MKALYIILISIFSLIIQSTILKHFTILGITPNLALIVLVCFSIFKGKYKGAFLGVFIGIIQDIIFSSVIGVNTLIYFLVGYVVGLFDDKVFKDNPFISTVFTSISTLSYHFLFFVFMYLLYSGSMNFFVVLNKIVIKEIIYNSILSIFVYKLFQKYFSKPYFRFR